LRTDYIGFAAACDQALRECPPVEAAASRRSTARKKTSLPAPPMVAQPIATEEVVGLAIDAALFPDSEKSVLVSLTG
jgi:hypothetical protein